jgi:hypothetical protein
MKKIQQIEATWKFQETGLKYNGEIHGAIVVPLLLVGWAGNGAYPCSQNQSVRRSDTSNWFS